MGILDHDACHSSPCGSHGTCIELDSGYLCICERGYTGSDCHSVCNDSICYNNSTCSVDDIDSYPYMLDYQCLCNETGSYGALCENGKLNPRFLLEVVFSIQYSFTSQLGMSRFTNSFTVEFF